MSHTNMRNNIVSISQLQFILPFITGFFQHIILYFHRNKY